MKLRVYYNGYKDRYYAQYRKCFIWFKYEYYTEHCLFGSINSFSTKESAIDFLKNKKQQIIEDREEEKIAKERSKKSGVIYEDEV